MLVGHACQLIWSHVHILKSIIKFCQIQMIWFVHESPIYVPKSQDLLIDCFFFVHHHDNNDRVWPCYMHPFKVSWCSPPNGKQVRVRREEDSCLPPPPPIYMFIHTALLLCTRLYHSDQSWPFAEHTFYALLVRTQTIQTIKDFVWVKNILYIIIVI